jgi:hypothetical protein
MKILTIVAVIVVLGCGLTVFSRHGRAQTKTGDPPKSSKEVFEGLRNQALGWSRKSLGLTATLSPTQTWGIVMDWVVTKGTATIVAISDGSASIYLSSGGGFLGGGGHESVRNAAKRMVAAAVECQQTAHPTNIYPLPPSGTVNFYFLTDVGVLTASASEADLRSHRSPLATLGEAGQNVITQYRLIQK